MQSTRHNSSPFSRIAIRVFIGLFHALQLVHAVVPTQVNNFGSVAVNGSGSVATVTFSLSGISATPVGLIGGVDFVSGGITCNGGFTVCTSNVTFLPKSPGLKQDALTLKALNGTVIASAFLYGIGTAPALSVLPGTISTLAGNGVWGYVNGAAASAEFCNPQGLAIDLHSNVYVADSVNQVIRKVAAGTGVVSTVAGNGSPGYSGDGGPALSATLNTPTGVAVDSGGNLFIADTQNGLIRRVDAVSGIITTVAGGGSSTADGVAATTAMLSGPSSVAIDTAGNFYIADSFHGLVRKVTVATGIIATVAGGGTSAGTDGFGDGGPATSAELEDPSGVALDAAGNLFIADTAHSLVRRMDGTTGVITAVAGTGSYGYEGDGGLATNAELRTPASVRIDVGGNLYISDMGSNVVRFVEASTGIISTIAGNGTGAYTGDGEVATSASLNGPSDVGLDPSGNLLIADYSNNVVRKIALHPPTLNFPSTNVDLISGLVPVTLVNTGNSTLNLSSLAITNTFLQKASGGTDCTATLSLVPGAVCQIALAFAPTIAGNIAGALAIGSNSENLSSSFSVNLAGTALSGTPTATLNVSSLNFASQAVGTTSSAQTIVLANTGTGSLSGINVTLAGQNIDDFNLVNTCQSSLAASASCTVAITFQPLLAGARTASVTFYDSVASSPQTVALTGTGTGGPIASLSTTALQFGPQEISTVSPAQSVTLTNSGTSALSLYSVSLDGPDSADFPITDSTCSGTLAPSTSCAVTVTFAPADQGSLTSNLVFNVSATNVAESVSLSGTGLPPPCVTGLATSSGTYAAAASSGSLTISAPSACAWSASSNVAWISLAASSGVGPTALQYTVAANTTTEARTGTMTAGSQTISVSQAGAVIQVTSGLRFVPMTPCRVIDTRNPAGAFGGPSFATATERDFPIPTGGCGIPVTAQAYAINVTVVPKGGLGFLNVWPSGLSQPLGSILNSDGRVKSNAAIIPAGTNGGIAIYASDPTQVIVDISGYFVSAADTSALAFYPLTPCRVVDTRGANGALGSPYLSALQARDFPIQSSSCNVPASAAAYSVNFTVIPKGSQLGYLSTWPAGQGQPLVSTLNDPTGTVVANAAIVQAGSGGAISVFATDDTNVIIDINGYFAAPQTGGLSLYNLTPCRVLDTRDSNGAPLDGILTLNIFAQNQCGTISNQAQAFVLNATVVPKPILGVLTLWPTGEGQPLVSTLNAFDGAVTSNLAIVPATNGEVNAYTSSASHLILDLFCYFGP